jgi:LacI family repressor for deo operon, udp, cdd, tsx, nupC, and nupG
MGHRHVAILMTDRPRQHNPIATRLAGLQQAFREVTGARLELVALEDQSRPDGGIAMVHKHGSPPYNIFLIGRQLAEKFLEARPRPTALVATDETIAHVTLGVFHARGIRVPDHVSLACYGGSYLSEYGAVPLTCVQQPVDDMARSALDLLLAPVLNKPTVKPELRLLPPRLILRASVASLTAGRLKEVVT